MARRATIEERFFSKVLSCADPLGCWEWGGQKNRLGYGQFMIEGRRLVRAHRWAYEFLRAPIEPRNLQIDHECCNRGCVNPWHMDAVSGGENMRRMVRRGRYRKLVLDRHIRGEPLPWYDFTPEYRKIADAFADAVDAGAKIPAPDGFGVLLPGHGFLRWSAVALLEYWGYLERGPNGLTVTKPPPRLTTKS